MRKQLSFTTMIAALALAACGGNDEVEPGNLASGDSLVPIADEAMLPDTMPPGRRCRRGRTPRCRAPRR